MRRAIWLVALLLLAVGAEAQDFIRYTPPPGTFSSGVTGTTAFFTGPVSIGNTAAAPYANLYGDAANVLALRNGTAIQSFFVYKTYTDASNYERGGLFFDTFSINLFTASAGTGTARPITIDAANNFIYADNIIATLGDASSLGAAGYEWGYLTLNRALMGSKSKALSDNSATNFVDVVMPQTAGLNYAGGTIDYTIFCKDATNQATQAGSVSFACQNLAGTETCGFGTPNGVTLGDGTAAIGTPAFTAAGGTDRAVISVQSDCSGVTPTTLTFQYRLNMQQVNVIAAK